MKYVFDYSKLKGRIIEKYGNQRNFAEHIGKCASDITKLLKGSARFTADIIEEWRRELEIEPSEVGLYFFKTRVDN